MLPCMRKAQEASTYAKNYRELSKTECRIMVFPRKKDADWLSNAKWPAIETHIQLTLSRQDKASCTYVLEMHMHIPS